MSLPRDRIAVLVDADNVAPDDLVFAVTDAARFGHVTIRRAFGRLSSLRGREKLLTEHGFSAEVALPGARSKDTADLILAQYAVRLAERDAVETIALVSSDTDFATIARGVAEAGVVVIGYGRLETPPSLRSACAAFVPFPSTQPVPVEAAEKIDREGREKLGRVIRAALDKHGNARTQSLGAQLNRAFGGDYKAYFKVKTLGELIKKSRGFEIREIEGKQGVASQVVSRVG